MKYREIISESQIKKIEGICVQKKKKVRRKRYFNN